MDTQENKNPQNDPKEQLKALEAEAKSAFKADNSAATMEVIKKIQAIDPENRLAKKLTAKLEKAKAKEYEGMLKTLLKDQDVEKLTALAKEFKDFDPENRSASKWIERAVKLKEKLSDKEEAPAESKPEAEKKPGLLGGLFKKKEAEAAPAPMPIKPMQTPAPVAQAPMPAAAVQAPAPTPTPTPAPQAAAPAVAKTELKPEVKQEEPKKQEKKEEKGNLFTRMFQKKDEEIKKESIIDTIVAKTDKKEAPKTPVKAEFAQQAKEGGKQSLLTFSKVFVNFAVIFVVLSAAFLYVEWIDKDNTVLSIVGIQENTGLRLHSAAEEVDGLKKEEEDLNDEIELYKGGYNDQALKTVQKIIDERIDWPAIFAKINEVTNSVYELNDFFKYIEYNNYSFDTGNRTIRVSGTLSDPLGRNLTKLVELEEAFKYYPKDKNNPDDTTKPYFVGFKEFTSFSKTLDIETGRYTSSFQLSFTLNQ